MKDKEKQIKEMTKDWDYVAHLLRFNDCYMLSLKQWSEPAKEMIKLGWIKPDKNSVVLSREEFELLTDIKDLQRQVQDSLSNMSEDIERIEKNARKETAERDFNHIIKALEMKKASIIAYYGIKESVGADIAIRTVKELAKQYNVKIKEKTEND